MPLAGVGYARWLFWDGRRDSLWAQALTPLESDVEHGITRTLAVRRIAQRYRKEYEAVFGPLPRDATTSRRAIDEIFSNLGKAIAAYERRLQPGPSQFDRFAEALDRGDETTHPLGPGGARASAVHRLRAVHELPLRPAPHERRVPQHGRAANAARYGSRRRRRPRGRGSLQLPGPIQRRAAGRLHGASLHRARPQAAARILQGSVPARRGLTRSVHARRTAPDAAGRARALPPRVSGARSATAS